MPSSSTSSPSFASGSKRKVSFNNSVTVFHVEHHCEYSDQEFQSCWQTDEDYQLIREEVTQTIDCYFSNTISMDESVSLCLRGLEDHTTDSEESAKAILRQGAWNAVLDEQEIQYDLGSSDSKMLREVYQTFSRPASRIARRKALQDAKEADHAVKGQSVLNVIGNKVSLSNTIPPCPTTRGPKNSIATHAA